MTRRPPNPLIQTVRLLSCIGVLLCASCATTPDEPATGTATAPVERICRGTATAGSKMRRTTCHTAAEWAIVDARTRAREASQEEFFRRASEGASLGPGPSFPSATTPGR